MKRYVLIAAALSACAPTETVTLSTQFVQTTPQDQAALSAVSDLAKDPGSVQFRDVRSYVTSGNQRIICGDYNARNSFGAYVGFLPFWVRTYENQPVHVVAAGDVEEARIIAGKCVAAATGKVAV